MTRPISAREAQSLRIRASLIDACANLMAEHPIDAITISNIVDYAGVAKGSFYNHFPDKEVLAATVSTSILDEVEEAIRLSNTNVTDPAYRIIRGMCTHIQLVVAEPRKATIMLRGHDWIKTNTSQLHLNVLADVRAGARSGRFSLLAEQAGALVVIGTGSATMIHALEHNVSVEAARDMATQAFTLVLSGFGLEEQEAMRIVRDSAADIIKG